MLGLDRAARRDEPQGIRLGQRFRAADGHRALWEVVAVLQLAADTAPHVRLARVGAPRDLKTVALRVLRDRHFFVPLS